MFAIKFPRIGFQTWMQICVHLFKIRFKNLAGIMTPSIRVSLFLHCHYALNASTRSKFSNKSLFGSASWSFFFPSASSSNLRHLDISLKSILESFAVFSVSSESFQVNLGPDLIHPRLILSVLTWFCEGMLSKRKKNLERNVKCRFQFCLFVGAS